MSTDKHEVLDTEPAHTGTSNPANALSDATQSGPSTPLREEISSQHEDERKAAATATASAATSPSTPEMGTESARQVIAVSASKGPTAFFNLARKFLVTDDMCDLSALEGAIVSAVDAAHLLERSQLATIVRVQTSYVAVEPKRKMVAAGSPHQIESESDATSMPDTRSSMNQRGRQRSSNRELRRARIVITVKRTESYERWLRENPLQAIIAVDGADDADGTAGESEQQGATDS